MKKTRAAILKKVLLSSDSRGIVLVMALGFISLMTIATMMFAMVLKQDIELIASAKLSEQAKNLAEAGMSHALAKLLADGIGSRSSFSGSLDTGTYAVTYSEDSGRILITSVGNVQGFSRSVSAEIASGFPTALNKMFAGGNDVKARAASSSAVVSIQGDIHANNDVELRAMGSGSLTITGKVSAVGIVQEGSKHSTSDNLDSRVFINGSNNDTATVYESQERVTYPVFEYSKYKEEAIDSGDYYSGDKIFLFADLKPGNGVVYVEGDATIAGISRLEGGIVADDIFILGALYQEKAGDRNFILARSKDVSVLGKLDVEEAIVYAKRDIMTLSAGTEVDVIGIMLAERDMHFWNVQTNVNYVHKLTFPGDLPGADNEDRVRLVSWTK